MGTSLEELVAVTARFRDDVTRLVAGAVDECDFEGRDLTVALQALERTSRTVTAAEATVVHHVDDTAQFVFDGHRSVKGWVGAAINVSGGAIGRLVGLSRFAASYPEVVAQLAGSELGVDQAAKLAQTANNPRVRRSFPETIDMFVKAAVELPFDVFATMVDNWVELNDQDGPHRPDGEAHQRRSVSFVSVGDRFMLKGEWGPIEGAALQEVYEQFVDAEFYADREWAQGKWEADGNTGPAPASLLPRTPRQRAADAVKAMFFAAAGAPPDGVDPVVDINLDVVIDRATFNRHLQELAKPTVADPKFEQALAHLVDPLRLFHDDGDFETADADDPCSYISRLGVCRLADGTLIHPQDAIVYALLHGTIRRAVYDTRGVVIDLGRRVRCFRGGSRDAAIIQAALDNRRRCSWPGCGRAHIQLDHRDEWRNGGATEPGNVDPKCAHHNVFKTSGYRVHRDTRGRWHHYRPDGTEILTT